jgi:hypothetical protein
MLNTRKVTDATKSVSKDKPLTASKEKPKVLSCMFWNDVLCSFRKYEKFGLMNRCLKCEHYLRFEREMDEEDQELDDYVREVEQNPDRYLRGEI